MNESKITVRYAKSFYNLIVEKDVVGTAIKNIHLLINLCESNQQFEWLLSNKTVKTSIKINIFRELFKDLVDQYTFSLLNLILTNKRDVYLHLILLNIINFHNVKIGVQQAHLYTPFELEPEEKQQFKKLVDHRTKKNVELLVELKPELIGGFVLRIEDQQFDSSISSQITKMKREFILKS